MHEARERSAFRTHPIKVVEDDHGLQRKEKLESQKTKGENNNILKKLIAPLWNPLV